MQTLGKKQKKVIYIDPLHSKHLKLDKVLEPVKLDWFVDPLHLKHQLKVFGIQGINKPIEIILLPEWKNGHYHWTQKNVLQCLSKSLNTLSFLA